MAGADWPLAHPPLEVGRATSRWGSALQGYGDPERVASGEVGACRWSTRSASLGALSLPALQKSRGPETRAGWAPTLKQAAELGEGVAAPSPPQRPPRPELTWSSPPGPAWPPPTVCFARG